MSFMDELRRLARPYEDDDDFLDEDLEEPFAEPREDRKARRKREDRDDDLDTGYTSVNNDKVVNINTTTQLQVVLVKPEKFQDASTIADHLRDKRTVVLNLESTNKDVARRMVDFLSGAAYAQEGKVKKVAVATYIITPYNVDIIGDLIDELENNGMYF
ncbi:MAG: cell division protein SepF [Clostridiales bacterium]|jgi:cell division inhibitor SepF|nr:MAG: cell division protein SepF [Clostridiales bacterium]